MDLDELRERRDLAAILKMVIETFRTGPTRGTADHPRTLRVAQSADDMVLEWLSKSAAEMPAPTEQVGENIFLRRHSGETSPHLLLLREGSGK